MMYPQYSFSVLAVAFYSNTSNGEIFMPLVKNIKNPQSSFKLPGGSAHKYENIETAILREIWEETGLHELINLYSYGKLDKSTSTRKHVQHTFALQILNLNGLHTGPAKDGNELLMVGIFPIKHIYESIITDSTILLESAINYEELKMYPNVHGSKVLRPHACSIYKIFQELEFPKLFGWE